MLRKVQPISSREATANLYRVFRLLGLDNLNRTWPYILHSFQLNFTSCFLQLIAFTTSYLINIGVMSISTLLTSLQVGISLLSVVLRLPVIYLNMARLRSTGLIIDELDKRILCKEERAVAEKMIRFCKGLTVVFISSYLAYSFMTFIAAIWNGHPPYGIYIPYCNWQESKTKMIVASLIEFYLINITCIEGASLDAFLVIIIYMTRMHMKILCIRVENIGKDSKASKEDNVKSLIDCIKTHKEILELVEIVRPVISKTFFIQFIVTVAIMGIPIINIMMFADTLSSAFGSIVYLFAVFLEIFPMCYTMNVLMDEVNSLPTAIFHCDWVKQNRKFRRMIVIYMQNAQQFKTIVAGNLFPIDLSTFFAIAKLSFSVYSVVDKMAERRSAHAA